jgi:hypothetical protein
MHTESVYFPAKAPFGEYVFYVDLIAQYGVADEWRVEVNEGDKKKVSTKINSGNSQHIPTSPLNAQKLQTADLTNMCFESLHRRRYAPVYLDLEWRRRP